MTTHLAGLLANLAANFVLLLPRPLVVLLARLLGDAAWLLDKRGRQTALANIEAALGPAHTPAQRRAIAHASYRNAARGLLDLLWSPRLLEPAQQKWLRVEERHGLGPLADQPGGVLFTCLHFGTFEWNNLAAARAGLPVMVVTQASKLPAVTAILHRIRSQSGNTMIPQERSVLRLLKHVKRRGAAGFLADLTMRPDEPSVVIETFGGLKMCVNRLAAELHLRTGAPLLPLSAYPRPDGSTNVVIGAPPVIPPDATPRQAAQILWDHFEPRIRERPELWLWSYKHFRYRPAQPLPGAPAYPAYANTHPAFDKLLNEP